MSSHMQLTRAAAGNQAADLQHYAAQQAPEQCGQLWTQLQELMQQREQAVSAREQQAAQYGQVEELLRALARHVQALLVDQQRPSHQLQEPLPAPRDDHAAALQVVRQLLQQASAAAVPVTGLQPLLPAQQQGKSMDQTQAQPAGGRSPPRSSTAHVGALQDTLQETVLAMQHAGEGPGLAGQQGPAQPQHMSPLPGQPQQQQQAAAELHALSRNMQAQLAHLQQLQATLDFQLQQAHLFSQYLAADSAAAAAFQAWQDGRQQAPPGLSVTLPLPPPPPQQQAQAVQQQEQAVQQQAPAVAQGTTHEQLRSSPDASAAVHSRAASPKPFTATQEAAYRLGRSRSRSRTPQPEQQSQQQQQQQADATLQDLGAALPSPLAGAAVGAAKRVRPYADSNGSAAAGDPGAAGSNSKRQRTDLLLPPEPAQPDGSGPAGDGASAADAAPEAGSTAVDAATGGAGASFAAAAGEGWVPAHPPPAGGSPAAAAAAPKPHLFRPTFPDRAKRPGAAVTADGISADAAAAVLGDRGALPVGRPGKQLWTQHRFGGRRAPGRGDKGAQLAPVSPAEHQQQQPQQPGQGRGWCQSPRQLQPQQQLQEPGQGQQSGYEDLDLDDLYLQEEQGQQGQQGQLVDDRAGAGQLLAVECQGDREAGNTGAAADKQEPPDTLYAAADGRIFYSHQAPGPQQLPLEGPGHGKQQHQQQQRKDQQHQQQQGKEQQQQPRSAAKAARTRKKSRKQRRLDREAAVDSRQAVAEAAGRSLQPSAAAAGGGGGGSISNGHAHPAAAAAAWGGGRQHVGLPSSSSGPLFQHGGRHPSHHPQHPQHSQQQRQAKPLPYQQQQHRGMLGPGGSKPRMRPRLGSGCGWGKVDEQDASLQDLQQQVAELAQQAAAVTAGGPDAAALSSS